MDVTLATLPNFASEFVASLPSLVGTHAHVVGLHGDLGAGKTTFVQHVARTLGVVADVTSPTFVIAQRYKTTHPVFTSLVHIDAYRLPPEEVGTIGWDMFTSDPHTLVLVEWPEKLGALFPLGAPTITFTVVDDERRTVTYVQ
jgi:tRNA threonylcarbamoyladenosine biosynthesis protein TsaE